MIATSLVQLDSKTLSPTYNFQRIAEFIHAEAVAGAQLILFPELANTGYIEPISPGSGFHADVPHYGTALYQACATLDDNNIKQLIALAAQYNVHVVIGLGLRDPTLSGVMHNSSVLIDPYGIVGHYNKWHLWQNEKLYFTPGNTVSTYEILGTRLGMQVCYDIRFPEITRILAMQGASIITNVWASAFPEDVPVSDPDLFIHRAYTRAIENGVFFLSCNRSGAHGNFRFLGRTCAIAPDGTLLGELAHDQEGVLRVQIDLSLLEAYRSFTGIWADRRPDLYAQYFASPSS